MAVSVSVSMAFRALACVWIGCLAVRATPAGPRVVGAPGAKRSFERSRIRNSECVPDFGVGAGALRLRGGAEEGAYIKAMRSALPHPDCVCAACLMAAKGKQSLAFTNLKKASKWDSSLDAVERSLSPTASLSPSASRDSPIASRASERSSECTDRGAADAHEYGWKTSTKNGFLRRLVGVARRSRQRRQRSGEMTRGGVITL